MILYVSQKHRVHFTLLNLLNSPFLLSKYAKKVLAFSIFLISFSVSSQEINTQVLSNTLPIESKDKTNLISHETQYKEIIDKADYYYKKKRYDVAIAQYTQSIKHLQSKDKSTQKLLGDIYSQIANSHRRLKNNLDSAIFYKKSLDVYTQLNDKKNMALTLKALAEAERNLGNFVIALNYSTESLKIYKTIDEPKGYAKALMAAGIIYRHIGRYEKSLIHIRQAYLFYKEKNDYNGIAKTSNEMGNIYIRLEQFKLARYFFQETINTSKEKLELKTIASALRSMAVIEFKHENYQPAMLHAKKAYQIYQQLNDNLKEAVTTRIIGNIYRAQKEDINAIDFYRKSMAIAIENKSEKHQIEAQLPLAELLIVQDVDNAIDLLVSSLKIAIRIKDQKQTFHSYHKLSIAEEYRGNFKQALYYAKKEIALTKVIQKKSENEKLILAKASLYSHKIEIELESLREKAKLDQLELAKKNDEIEIVDQSIIINELKLTKDKYASIALTFLLVICVILAFFVYRRFTSSKKHNKTLKVLASRDPLTNCYNRRSLFEFMDEYLINPELNRQYCVIMADIDHFKNVNDTYGHNMGDTVICGFASTLQDCIRQDDIVARFGGEEFCIILHQVTTEKALSIAEKMRYEIENSTFDNINITSSFGITSLEFGATTPKELIEQADLALYKSKYFGRNKVTLWSESFN